MFVCKYIFDFCKKIHVDARRIKCHILKVHMGVGVMLGEFICSEIHVVLRTCVYTYVYIFAYVYVSVYVCMHMYTYI